jgi:hypothetical protein
MTEESAGMVELPSALKVAIASYLSARDAVRLSHCCKTLYDDLALAQLPMKIPFKSWYDDDGSTTAATSSSDNLRRGPKIPFLPHRTHSVTLTGSWSCKLGELQGRHYTANSQAQFYIVAYPEDSTNGNGNDIPQDEELFGGGGRIVWASRPLCQRHFHQSSSSNANSNSNNNNNSSWVRLTVTFYPQKGEAYYLCVRPGPGRSAHDGHNNHMAMMASSVWRHSLHLCNLIAHITYHDNPHTNFLLKRQYKTIVKHIHQVENRAAYYTKILEAVARSIRIQLARFGLRNALDPVLESFFQSTGIPRDTDSLLVLEEIARFLSHYAYVNERRKHGKNNHTKTNNVNTPTNERESVKSGKNSTRDSVPDWVPYAESSVANRSSSHDWTSNTGGEEVLLLGKEQQQQQGRVASAARTAGQEYMVRASTPFVVPDVIMAQQQQQQRPSSSHNNNSSSKRKSKRLMQWTVHSLWKLPSTLWRAGTGKHKGAAGAGHRRSGQQQRRHTGLSSWRTDEITEEFSISVLPPEQDISATAAAVVAGLALQDDSDDDDRTE